MGVVVGVRGADGGICFLQAEARCRLAGEGAPGVVAAARCGNADAVELHVIADAGAVHALDR